MSKRALLVGIDEAGYGPVLGPLVVSASVFEVGAGSFPLNFWELLKNVPVVRPEHARSGGLVVGDSKQVYGSSNKSLERLEAGVLSFARAAGMQIETTLEDFVSHFGSDGRMPPDGCEWYDGEDITLPCEADEVFFSDELRSGLEASGIRFHGFLVRPVFGPEFNREVRQLDNKADFLFQISVSLSAEVIKNFGDATDIFFLYDKQGGRKAYGPMLLETFPGCGFLVENESKVSSAYQLLQGGRRFFHRFEMKGDDRHLPIALASMCSKYVRELYLRRFNSYWKSHLPELRPTAGYYVDAQRFLKETEKLRAELAVDDDLLIRIR